MKEKQIHKVLLFGTYIVVSALLISGCKTQESAIKPEPTAQFTIDPTAQIMIGPNVPHDVPGGVRLPASVQSDNTLAAFAWQQFLALSWQSNYDTITHSRGTPDMNWNYTLPYDSGQSLVWETFAHRSELRPWGVALSKPFSKAPEYLFKNTTIKQADGARFDLFNNLDEDNEIGSCSVYNGPGDSTTQYLVIYQAKVNQAEYDYIKDVFGATQYDTAGALARAADSNAISIMTHNKPSPNGIDLPAGDNSVEGIAGEGAIEIKTAFLLVTEENDSALAGFFRTQAIYYTADYDTGSNKYSNWQYHNGTFALLAIHVIHKTKSYPHFIFTSFEHMSLKNMPFQYILLTPSPPTYPSSNFNPFHPLYPFTADPATQYGDRHLIERQTGTSPTSNGELYPIPLYRDVVTEKVHAQLWKLNPKSVWLNYRLIGVQANITERWAPFPIPNLPHFPPVSPLPAAGPNHFMANHVVESDAFLGNFFGPGFGTNPFPTGPLGPDSTRNGDNILFEGKTYNMGGCKGCHGVAQTAFGTDHSFLLDFANKPVRNPDTIIYHPDED